jgi:hypothetical protein
MYSPSGAASGWVPPPRGTWPAMEMRQRCFQTQTDRLPVYVCTLCLGLCSQKTYHVTALYMGQG